ncbi:hypothetical protein [Streptomyces sp. NPDC095613]|uniref:hypothetical protein n=1 Tax=Streptomyces sp. NPDC095613 TaxID=3155540 RepID=UPI00331DFDD1
MPNTELQNQVLSVCKENLSQRSRWDERPELLVLERHDDAGLTAQRFPVPDVLWERRHPAEVLTAVADFCRLSGMVAPADTVAVALRYEAYSISCHSSPQAAEAIRRRAVGGSVPRNEEIPGRVEQRRITAVDRQGYHYDVAADRQSDGTAAPPVGQVVSGSVRLSGRIPDALTAFSLAIDPNSGAGDGASGSSLSEL